MAREYNKMFDGKRFALVNVVKTNKRADNIVRILTKEGDKTRKILVDGGLGIYRRNKNFRD